MVEVFKIIRTSLDAVGASVTGDIVEIAGGFGERAMSIFAASGQFDGWMADSDSVVFPKWCCW